MKKITLITLISIFFSFNTYAIAEVKCKDLPGFKKVGKNSGEYIECLANKIKKSKFKLNTQSTLTDWVTGKKKISNSVGNPITGLKNLGKALKPDKPDISFKKK